MKDFIRSLNTFMKKMDDFYPYMNYGGCCVFAGILGKHLESIGPTRVRVGGYGEDVTIDDVRRKVMRSTVYKQHGNRATLWNRHNLYFAHVVVEFDYGGRTYHIDTKGVCGKFYETNYGGYPLYDGSLTVDEAIELGSHKNGWNESFDRDLIPDIQNDVDRYFARVVPKLQQSC